MNAPGSRRKSARRFPFKNLVFQGGGVKTFVYHGALRVFNEYGILPQIERVAGTSAGAVQATLLCFRLDVEQTIALYREVDFSQFSAARRDDGSEHREIPFLDSFQERARNRLDAANRFIRHYGLYSTAYMHEYLQDTIADFCGGNGRATFAEFRSRGFRDLYTTAVNLNRRRPEIFCADTTPDVAVADAVMMSSSIPFFFEALQFDGRALGEGDYYVDGGALSNYPLTIFDDPRFKANSRHFTHGVNWETLGCQLYHPENLQNQADEINGLFQYATSLIETLAGVQDAAVAMRLVDRWRSIRISNCGVSTVDFSVKVRDDDPKYIEMVKAGEAAARDYLGEYRLPTDHPDGLRGWLADFLDIGR